MSRVIGQQHPERTNIQSVRFTEPRTESGEIPFVVELHEKYKSQGSDEESLNPVAATRGRPLSPVRPTSSGSTDDSAFVVSPSPAQRAQAQRKERETAPEPSETERVLLDLSARVTALTEQVEQARSEMEGRVQEAFERGLSEGERMTKEGQRQEAEAYAYGLTKLGHLGTTLETLARHEAMELAILIAKRIMQKEVEVSPMFLIEAIKRTGAQLLGRNEMTIRLHPADLAVVRTLAPDFSKEFPAVALVTLSADDSLERGDITIDTDVEQINLTLNEQLAALKQALDEEVRG